VRSGNFCDNNHAGIRFSSDKKEAKTVCFLYEFLRWVVDCRFLACSGVYSGRLDGQFLREIVTDVIVSGSIIRIEFALDATDVFHFVISIL
jgi:hypothetical protein